jgi:leader peptidase (prepilin peptidase) / N-methyltransferase
MVIVILAILGLALGSFINAFVWRLHKKKDWVKERSICVHCGHVLAARDLIPVFSWLALKGKCRYCKKSISRQYPVVELATSLLFVGSYMFWPLALSSVGTTLFVFWLVFLVGLVALTVYDIKWMLLPDKVVYPLMVLALIQTAVLLFLVSSPTDLLADAAFSFLVGGGIFYALFHVSDGRWIGGGDVKLGALLGLILIDWQLMLFTIFTASLLGTAFSLPLMATKRLKKTSKIPFGPFLIAGAIIARLFGSGVIDWYMNLL